MNARPRALPAALNRARRRAGFDRNPMRRREDRIQSAVGLILAIVFLATAPLAAIMIGGLVYGSELHSEHVQAAQRHTVTAKVTGLVTAPSHSTVQTLTVSWRDARGTPRKADCRGTATEIGTMTTIWVDRSDHVVPPPHKHAQTITETAITAIGSVLAILAVLTSAYALLGRRLDRGRYRLWDADWAWADITWGQGGNRPGQG